MIAAEVKYKKTGIDWLAEIPEHWKVVRLKFLDELIMGQSPSSSSYNDENKGYAFLQGNAEFGEIFPTERIYTTEPRKIAPAGSILYSVRAPIGAVNKADKDYCIGRGLCSIIPIKTHPDFLYFVTLLAKQELNSLGTGSTFTAIAVADVSNISVPVPPYNEQEAIASYLNTESAKITRFIQTKQRFIELLKEQRQSIITNAVTKGIDDGVKMKETVLGEIPEHWEVRRLGTIGRFSKGGNISRSELIYTDEGVPAILYGDLYTKYDIVAENIINRITKETAAKSVELKKGDLLFTGSGETKEDIGKCVIFNSIEPAYAGGDVIIFKQDIFDSYFISYSQNSSIARYQKAISSKGEIIVHTYGSKLRDIIMPYPPTIEEQKRIVEYIKTETKTLDIAISKAEREIELIKEYREAMIAEAVTGKMKL